MVTFSFFGWLLSYLVILFLSELSTIFLGLTEITNYFTIVTILSCLLLILIYQLLFHSSWTQLNSYFNVTVFLACWVNVIWSLESLDLGVSLIIVSSLSYHPCLDKQNPQLFQKETSFISYLQHLHVWKRLYFDFIFKIVWVQNSRLKFLFPQNVGKTVPLSCIHAPWPSSTMCANV